MANKSVKFKTKLFYEGKVYLKVSDVSKALGYSNKQGFISDHANCIVLVSGSQYIKETDYNELLSNNPVVLSNQGYLEVTKVETLSSKIDSIIGFQTLKLMFARDYLKMMVRQTGCKSETDYIMKYELPDEYKKALEELIAENASYVKSYNSMIEYLHDKERFDLEHIRSFGLDVQYLSSIDCTGKIDLDVYVVGMGVFIHITDMGDYVLWNDMYRDSKGDIILPWCNYDSKNPDEVLVNISQCAINRDFRNYNAIENMIWCIENLDVVGLEDYDYAVFDCNMDTINFSMSAEMLVKLIKPETISTIYADMILDIETEKYITEVNKDKVFANMEEID